MLGRPREKKPLTRQVLINLPAQMKVDFIRASMREGLPMAAILRRMIQDYLSNDYLNNHSLGEKKETAKFQGKS